MTLKTKNLTLKFSSALIFLFNTFLLFAFVYFPQINNGNQVSLFIISINVTIISFFVYLYFKKSVPSEIILFTIFILSLSMQSVRIVSSFTKYETFAISIFIGRVSIFFKYLGLLSLLGASLFTFSIKKQKVGSWLLLTLFVSIIIAAIIHFNTGQFENILLPRVIFKMQELVISISTILLTVITFIKSGYDTKNKDYIILGISSLLLSISILLTFVNLSTNVLIIIILLLNSGSILYLKSLHNITLWS